MLRFAVESAIADFDNGIIDRPAVVNGVMRNFVQAMAAEQVARSAAKRQFLTFRRDPEATVPGWAFRNPGNASRLPAL